eukprot:5146750-Amphidinium_carterae.3
MRDLALLPMNLNGCFPELNFYAQCHEYFDRSIEFQRDGVREYNQVRQVYDKQDAPYGRPDSFDFPTQTLIDWCRWAHAKSVNMGHAPSQSRAHLIEGLFNDEVRLRGSPLEGSARRQEPETPPGP